ncbi:hypothetical protein RZS08_42065, partial [Arthrospira platensis SPKY1]|nr:hypothetical protein [Arthrospira platensis SPKY1]
MRRFRSRPSKRPWAARRSTQATGWRRRFAAGGRGALSGLDPQRRDAVQQDANQLGLPPHHGLREDRAQVGTRGIAANPQRLRSFLERGPTGQLERDGGLRRGEVEELAHRLR